MAFEDKYLWYKIRINVLLISNNFLDLLIFLNLLLFSILDCYFSLFFNIKVTPAISESAIQQMQSVFCDIIDDWYVNNRTKIYVCVFFFFVIRASLKFAIKTERYFFRIRHSESDTSSKVRTVQLAITYLKVSRMFYLRNILFGLLIFNVAQRKYLEIQFQIATTL